MERKYKIILLTIFLGVFMTSLDATIVSVALPTIAKSLGEAGHDTKNISWVLLVYTLMLCCFILLWSRIGTNIGYKKIFMCGITVFSISSLGIGLCGLNTSLGLGPIVLLRGIQGLGAGMCMSVSLAMVSAYLPPEVRGSSVAAVTMAASIGTAFGPVLGGLLTAIDWAYIFYINVPIGIICLILCIKYMNVEENISDSKSKVDYIGAIFMFIMMFSLIFYLNKGSEIGWMSEKGIILLAAAFIAAGLFVHWEGRSKFPLVSLRLIKDLNISKANIVGAILFMAMGGSYLLLPYYLGAGANSTDTLFITGALSYNTIEYGLILVSSSIGMLAIGPAIGKLSDRTGDNKTPIIIGAVLSAISFVMMCLGFNSSTQLWYIVLTLFIMGAGVGMAMIGTTNLAFSYKKEGEDGQLSGLTNTFRQAGTSAGVAILETIFTGTIIVTRTSIVTVDVVPGLKHAFFVAAIMAMVAFVIAMSCKNKKECNTAEQ